MRKYLIGTAMVGLCLTMTACNKAEEPAATNETVVEEAAPVANEGDMNGMDMNAADANAADAGAADANAADANATE